MSALGVGFGCLPSCSLDAGTLSVPVLFVFSDGLLNVSRGLHAYGSCLYPSSFAPSRTCLWVRRRTGTGVPGRAVGGGFFVLFRHLGGRFGGTRDLFVRGGGRGDVLS